MRRWRAARAAIVVAAAAACGAPPRPAPAPAPMPTALVVRPPRPGARLPPVPGHEAPFARRPLAELRAALTPAADVARVADAAPPPLLEPAAGDGELAALGAAAAQARGAARLAARGARAHALTVRAAHAPDDAAARAAAVAAYAEVFADPAHAASPFADAWLYDQARLALAEDRLSDAQRAVVRLYRDHSTSPLVPEGYLLLGEAGRARGELPLAVDAYEHVVQYAAPRTLDYARYQLGWAYLDSGDGPAAVAAWAAVARGGNPVLRQAALDDLATAYAVSGSALTAGSLFRALEPARAVARLEELAARYLDLGKDSEAILVLGAALAAQPDPVRACLDHVALVRAEVSRLHRDAVVAHAAQLAGLLAAPPVAAGCAPAADALLGELAWVWHDEQRQAQAHPEPIIALWELVARVSPAPRRRALALANRAALLWRLAGQRWDAAAWTAAAQAAGAAAAAIPDDPALAADAVDAWDNAGRSARRAAGPAGRLEPAVRARIHAGLAAAARGPAAARAAAVDAALR